MIAFNKKKKGGWFVRSLGRQIGLIMIYYDYCFIFYSCVLYY